MSCEVTVVIPTLGQSPHLRGLLEHLQRQRTEFTYEVLVVANIPQQQLRTVVNSMGTNSQVSFVYLETGRLGVNIARNKGLERARGEYVVFLDDDMILDDDSFIARHVTYHREHLLAVGIGGPYKLAGQHSIWDAVYQDTAHDWLRRQATFDNGTTQLLGGNVSFKRKAMMSNKWTFDEVIGFGGAETSLCTRISSAGHRLLLFPELEIGHSPQMTARKFLRKAYLQGAGAHLRKLKFPEPTTAYVNSYLPMRRPSRPFHRTAMKLYQLFFDFGWDMNPYSRPKNIGSPWGFSGVAFLWFTLRRMKPFVRFRALHRSIYATLRSAWINGAVIRPDERSR